MSIKAKISVDNSELKKGLQDAQKTAQAAGNNIGKSFKDNGAIESLDKLGKGADEAVRAIDSVAGAAGGASTGLSGLAGDIVALVKSPIALLMAALGGLVTLGVHVWDKMTESVEEYKARMEATAATQKKKFEELQKEQEFVDSLSERLIELSFVRNKTTAETSEEAAIVAKLEARYGDLGITLNETTGEYIGLYDALLKVQKLEYERTKAASDRRVKLARKAAHVDASALTGELSSFNKTIRYDMDRYNSPAEARNMGYDVKFNTEGNKVYVRGAGFQTTEISEDEKAARRAWNEGGIEGKIAYLEWLQENADKFDIEAEKIQAWIDHFNELKAALEESSSIQDLGEIDPQSFFRTIQRMSEQSREITDSMKEAQKAAKQVKQDWEDTIKFQNASNDEKIAVVQGRQNETIQEIQRIEADLQQALKQTQEYDAQRQKLEREFREAQERGENPEYGEYMQKLTILQHAYAASGRRTAALMAEQKDIMQEWVQNERTLLELKQKQENFYKDRIQTSNDELEILDLIIAGKDEEAERLRVIQQLRREGLKVEEDKLAQILAGNKALKERRQIQADQQAMEKQNNDYDLKNEVALLRLQGKDADADRRELQGQFKTAGADEIELLYQKMQRYKEIQDRLSKLIAANNKVTQTAAELQIETLRAAGKTREARMKELELQYGNNKAQIAEIMRLEDELEAAQKRSASRQLTLSLYADQNARKRLLEAQAGGDEAEIIRTELKNQYQREGKTVSDTDLDKLVKRELTLRRKARANEQREYLKQRREEYQAEVDLIEAQKTGDEYEIARIKVINELRARGFDITKDDLGKHEKLVESLTQEQLAIQQANKELEYQNRLRDFKQSIKDEYNETYFQMLEAAGRKREAALMRNLTRFESVLGQPLNDEQRNQIKALTDLQYELSGAGSVSNQMTLRGVQTNELAARGGFASSVVRDKTWEVNYQILHQAKQQAAIMGKIKQSIDKFGVIQ